MTTADLYNKKEECCGCGSCATSCPKDLIEMTADNTGFLYPVIIENSVCIDCQQCIQCCPMKTTYTSNTNFLGFFAGSLNNNNELMTCASGGLATAISRMMALKGTVIYGAGYTDNWESIEYFRVSNINELEKLKTSKYAQATKADVYLKIHDDFVNGMNVLFIGLPCDVAAVKQRFSKYDEALYTVALICHGPTSLEVHRQYISNLRKRFSSNISSFSTRAKKNGKWKPFYIHAVFTKDLEFYEKFHESSYGAAFRYLKRPSCYTCKIKRNKLNCDLLIGDYHHVEVGMKGYNLHGVSSAIVCNVKGLRILNDLHPVDFTLVEIDKYSALGNGSIFRTIPVPHFQKVYVDVFVKQGLIKASKTYIVVISNLTRKTKAIIMKYGVLVKRLLVPSSKP